MTFDVFQTSGSDFSGGRKERETEKNFPINFTQSCEQTFVAD